MRGSGTNVTLVVMVESALQVFFLLLGYLTDRAPPAELQAPLSVVALGLALYFLPADFPRRPPPCKDDQLTPPPYF